MGRTAAPVGPRTAHVGANIRARRIKAGLTISELADAATSEFSELTERNLGYIELGNVNIRLEQLFDIAAALGCSPCTLLNGAADA